MVLCAAYGCNSRSGVDRVSFFRFPKDVGLRKVWIQRLNRGESATKSFAPKYHHRLCSKHFDDSSFIISPKFAQEIGYRENFILRLKEDAVPSIFVNAEGREKRPAPAERRSASAILEKKRKLHLKSSLYMYADVPFTDETQHLPESSDDFLDSDTFTAELLSSTVSTAAVKNRAYQDPPLLSANTTWTSTTCTTVTSTASTHDLCQTVSSSNCPLSWFADVTLTLPKIHSSTITEPASSTQQKESEPSTQQKESEPSTQQKESEPSSTCTHQKESESSTRQKEVFSIQCQTPHNLLSKRSVMIQNSPVMVDKSVQTKCKSKIHMPQREPLLEMSLDDSFVSVRSNDPRDPEWTPDHLDDSISDYEDEIDSNSCEKEENEASEKKFIVYESCLDELLRTCSECGLTNSIDKRTIGTCVIYNMKCLKCENVHSWSSQPMSGTMPYGNLILSAAIMFAGASPVKYLRVLEFAAIQTLSLSTYMNIQSSYLTPTVMDVWKSQQQSLIQTVKDEERSLKLAGDARCCSPGHTAKFGSYSMMDLHTGKILDIKLVQSNEVANSYGMELEGLKRSLAFLRQENQLTVSDIITDRHSSVKKYLREEQPTIRHWFDVWHVAKGVYKKLEAAGKRKGCQKVKDWARSISNHMYWCASSSGGDGELVQQKWLSILNHVVNIHEGHGDKFPRCLHEEIEDRDWMLKGYKPYAAMEKIVNGKLLVNDIKKLSPDEQTSSLESFHNIVCNYTSKAVHYFHPQMEARLALAALHFNENTRRRQAVTKTGELRYAMSFPKAKKGEGIAREVKIDQTFEYIDQLMDHLLAKRTINKSYLQARRARALIEPARPPPLAQSTPVRPRKEELVNKHLSRFST